MLFATANSQDLVFGKGSSAINLGIGFGNTMYNGSYYKMAFPSISASYEYGIVEIPMGSSLTGVVSVGGLFGVGGSKYDWSNSFYGYSVNTTYFLMAVRGNYHFIFHEKFDPYAGISLGYYFGNNKFDYPDDWNSSWNSYNENTGGFHGGVYAGARWFFSPAWAVFSELGAGYNYISIFTFGGTFRF